VGEIAHRLASLSSALGLKPRDLEDLDLSLIYRWQMVYMLLFRGLGLLSTLELLIPDPADFVGRPILVLEVQEISIV
jgi:hypothetical protein